MFSFFGDESLVRYADAIRQVTPIAGTLIGSLALVHIMGLIDDRKAIGAWPKLIVMTGVAWAITYFSGDRLLTLLDGYVGGPWLSYVVTIMWLVIVMNAINFMDNMDGVAAGVTTVAGTLILAVILLGGEQWKVGLLLALLVGSSAGFLIFNFPRASIFMGDGGSLVLGLMLGVLTIRTTYYGGDVPTPWFAVFIPLIVLSVPLYDFLSVIVIRIVQGKSPMVGDQQHFGHRLRARGLSDRQVWLVMCGATAVTGIAGIVLSQLDSWFALLIPLQVGLVLTLVAVYEHGSASPRNTPRTAPQSAPRNTIEPPPESTAREE